MATIYGGPFAIPEVRKNPGNLMDFGQMADAIRQPGQDKKTVSDKIRWYSAQGYIHPVAKESEGKRSFLFEPSTCIMVEVLIRMQETGIADSKVHQAVSDAVQREASNAFSFWNESDLKGQEPPAPNPLTWVMRGVMAGYDGFGFEIVTLRSTDTGALAYAARVRHLDSNSGTQFHLPNDSYERRSVWACDLDSIARYIKRGKAN